MFEKGELGFYIILASFIMPLVLSAILIWFVITYQKRKSQHEIALRDNLLKQQQLIIEKQQAIEAERNRIASEMHDDLGSGLTTIKYLSERARKYISQGDGMDILQRIEAYARDLVSNMSEIIWTMNTRFDDVANLAGFMRRYAFDYLENYEMDIAFHIHESCGVQPLNGEVRRDLFLALKEILHNSVKYSGARKIYIHMTCDDDLELTIEEEGGRGFDIDQSLGSGNGLYNMRRRLENIGGSIEFTRRPHAMAYRLVYPLKKTDHLAS